MTLHVLNEVVNDVEDIRFSSSDINFYSLGFQARLFLYLFLFIYTIFIEGDTFSFES